MYSFLLEIKQKYDRIQQQMLQPETLQNIKEYKKLLFKANNIKEVVAVFNQYEIINKDANEAKKILKNEKDKAIIELAKIDLDRASCELPKLEEEIKMLLIPKDPNDNKNVIVEIRGAAGGVEANIFASDLFDLYKKWSIANRMKMKLINQQRSENGGFSLIVFRIEGENAYSKLKFESGVHRVQRIPVTETQGRVHTSTATVTVMPEADETVEIEINPSDLKIDTFRSSGAGGQSVNTTDSAVRITHLPTNIVVSSQDERSQLQNRETCLSILKTKLFNLEVEKQQHEDAAFRALAGSGARSEKVRTYNYPQDRVTDHRIALSVSLKNVLEGKINNIIETLQAAEKANRVKKAKV